MPNLSTFYDNVELSANNVSLMLIVCVCCMAIAALGYAATSRTGHVVGHTARIVSSALFGILVGAWMIEVDRMDKNPWDEEFVAILIGALFLLYYITRIPLWVAESIQDRHRKHRY